MRSRRVTPNLWAHGSNWRRRHHRGRIEAATTVLQRSKPIACAETWGNAPTLVFFAYGLWFLDHEPPRPSTDDAPQGLTAVIGRSNSSSAVTRGSVAMTIRGDLLKECAHG